MPGADKSAVSSVSLALRRANWAPKSAPPRAVGPELSRKKRNISYIHGFLRSQWAHVHRDGDWLGPRDCAPFWLDREVVEDLALSARSPFS